MIQLMKYKFVYLMLSAALLIPGIVSLGFFGLKLSIDFTGGSVFLFDLGRQVTETDLQTFGKIFNENLKIESEKIAVESGKIVSIRTKPIPSEMNDYIKLMVSEEFADAKQVAFETVGPAVGMETTKSAIVALIWASVGILLYMAFTFRNIPKPYSSFRFGASAILAMLHDAVLVLGVFSVLGHFYKIEVDALFITALLTVIGFSVHDTIVVFDRIRENLGKLPRSYSFEDVVNYSTVETLSRSFATSLTVIITLSALFVLGGESIKVFVLTMLIGIISGTYSSIFTAAPILILWETYAAKRKK